MSAIRTIKSAAAKCSISYLFLMRAHVPAVALFTTAWIQNCRNFFATGRCDISRQSETKTNAVNSTSRTLPPSYVNYPELPRYTTTSHFDSAPKLSKVMANAVHVVAAQSVQSIHYRQLKMDNSVSRKPKPLPTSLHFQQIENMNWSMEESEVTRKIQHGTIGRHLALPLLPAK